MKFIEHLSNNRKWYLLGIGIAFSICVWFVPNILEYDYMSLEWRVAFLFSILKNFSIYGKNQQILVILMFILNGIMIFIFPFFKKLYIKLLYFIPTIVYCVYLVPSNMQSISIGWGYKLIAVMLLIIYGFMLFIDNIHNKLQSKPRKQTDKQRIEELERRIEELEKDKNNY